MEILSLSKSSLRVKGKRGSFILDPDSSIRSKVSGDAIIEFPGNNSDESKVEEWRVKIGGIGEYEVGGIKISGVKAGKNFAYKVFIDNISMAFARADSIDGLRDILNGQQVLVILVNDKIDMSFVATLEPRVVILYGDKADGEIKTSKYSITRDKLPEKMETILLQ